MQKQTTLNVVHKERFYTEASKYDRKNHWNEILLSALRVTIRQVQSGLLLSKAKNLSLHFPDWPAQEYNRQYFERLHYDRKTVGYKPSISLAKLILLQLNPQVASGNERVVAILFDMNRLWEDWLLATYRSSYRGDLSVNILGKRKKLFWKSEHGPGKVVETDILVEVDGRVIVLDAKWKTPKGIPSDDELKQMLAYNLQWNSTEAWLVYPKVDNEKKVRGSYQNGAAVAGRSGMAFVDIFTGGGLRRYLKLPEDI